jgi:hypothetical protein
MNDEQASHPNDDDAERSNGGTGPQTQEIRHSQVSALVPEKVARGVFSTGAVVVQGAHEFILDFLLRMTSPQQLAARVVLPPSVVGRLIAALSENLKNYEKKFGPPQTPPTPQTSTSSDQPAQPEDAAQQQAVTQQPAQQQASAQELYDQLKLPDDVLSGAYANAVMIGHSGTEFCFDFITTFFPRSAVSCRVYLAAANVPRFLDSLKHSFDQYQRKLAAMKNPNPPSAPDPPPETT